MIGFCCAMPYHLLLALQLATHEFRDEQKVLIVFDHFNGVEDIVAKIKHTQVFKEVVLIRNKGTSWQSTWRRRLHYFYFYSGISKICNEYYFEKFIFFHLHPTINALTIKHILRKSPFCEIYFGEDGLGAYVTKDFHKPSKINHKMRMLLKITGWGSYLDKFKYYFVVRPELIAYKSTLEFKKISEFKSDDAAFCELLSNIWNEKEKINNKVLFLQQNLKNDGYEALDNIQKIFFRIIAKLDIEKYITVKLHPRATKSDVPSNCSNCDTIQSTTLYELLIRETGGLKLIVSVFSSATFTPFLLWGHKVPLVLLYKMQKNIEIPNNLDNFIDLFKRRYAECGGKIYLPETEDELVEILKKYV